MIIKYINEAAFGSYKNSKKLSDDEKKVSAKQKTADIINKHIEENFIEVIATQLWYFFINGSENEDILNYFALCTYRGNGRNHRSMFKITYDNPADDFINVKVSVLCYFYYYKDGVRNFPNAQLNYIIDGGMQEGGGNGMHSIKRDLNYMDVIDMCVTYLNKQKDIVEATDKTFGVEKINWDIKFHLIDKDNPEKLFNEDIIAAKTELYGHQSRINCTYGTIKDIWNNITPAFEWFKFKTFAFVCNDMDYYLEGSKSLKGLHELGKIFKAYTLKFYVSSEITGLDGNGYKNLLMTSAEGEAFKERFGEDNVEANIPAYMLDSLCNEKEALFNKSGVVQLYSSLSDALFRDHDGTYSEELINEIFEMSSEDLIKNYAHILHQREVIRDKLDINNYTINSILFNARNPQKYNVISASHI